MTSSRWDTSRSEAKLEKLGDVLSGAGRRSVLCLAHNNPDPDTIASVFGLQFLLQKAFGVRSVMAYGGVVSRAENQSMIQRLRIDMTRLTKIDLSKYYGIALLDAQPGTGNNLLDGKGEPPLIVIDHHPLRKASGKAIFRDIRPEYGTTSTIITEYLVAAGIKPSRSVANALLYGIKTDTNSLIRGAAKQDFHAFHYLSPLTNPRMIGLIENPVLPEEYFEELHRGITRTIIYRDVAISYLGSIHSEAIIPELADLLLRIDGVSWSFCFGKMKNLMLLSLRSTSRTYFAGTVLRKLVGSSGSAGGHREMAGGQVAMEGLTKAEKRELPEELIEKFLQLIDREGCHSRRLVSLTQVYEP